MAELPDSSPKPNEDKASKPAASAAPPPPPTGQTPPPPPASGPTLADTDASAGLTLEIEEEPEWRKTADAVTSELGDWSLFVRRSLRSDFYRERATDGERQRLAEANPPVQTELAQDYAAWRRGMLWFTFVAMVVAFIFVLIETISSLFSGDVPGVIKFVVFVVFSIQVGATILVGVAAFNWVDLNKSRKLTRFAWLVLFGGPIVLLIIPWASMASGLSQLAAAQEMVAAAIRVLFPLIMGLFAGLIRSGLTLKTLLPESSSPGWMTVLVTPFYVLFFLVPLAIAIQLMSSFLLILALFAFILSPILLLVRARKLMLPMDAETGHRLVQSIRRTSAICISLGFFFIFILVIDALKDVSIWSAISALASFLTSVLLLSLVMSDFMLGMMSHGFAQSQAIKGTEAESALARKFVDLSNVGIGNIDMGEGAVFEKLGSVAKFANFVGKELVSGGGKNKEATAAGKSESVESESDNPKESK